VLPGARGSAARCVETRLVQLGYTLTGPDDSFDSTAVAALKAFQAERGGSVNGVAWRSTLQQLGIWVDPPPAPAPTCRVSLVVKLGGIGDPARCVETRLVQLGYGLSGPDSRFDATAVTALRAFQLLSGLPSDGIGWKSTLQRLGIWTDPQPLPAPTCFVSMPVKLGIRGEPARCLETRLVQLGYSLTGPDDNFDATAVSALRAFQSRFGLANDGVAWKSSLVVLGIWKEPVPMPPATCFTAWTVRAGDWGYPTRCLETRLAQLGFWLGNPNDTFDSYGVAALKRFQARYGLASSGVADIYTLGRLGIYRALVAPAATCRTHFAVRLGSTGSGARCVESRLAQLGYQVSGPNDVFDATAWEALRVFQYMNGLTRDGIAGPQTLLRLGIYDPNPPPATALPENSGSGRRIVYSRAQQRIWAVDANGVVVKTHRVSGRLFEPYRGTYHVYSRSLYTNSITDPSIRWMYMVRFAYGPQGGRIGFHEIPNRNGVPLQSSEQLGLPLSGGCVRQSTADARWVWNWAYIGTKVVVL
jgi:peptidoglycan hydrolase-like protein with peptidoglycan-binding domain